MKKLSFLMAALLVAMTGCQKEPQGTETVDGDAYMSFSIQTLKTRSATDSQEGQGNTESNASPDYEVGTDTENTISTVNVVLRLGDKFISATNVEKVSETNTDSDVTTIPNRWLAKFNSSEIDAGKKYFVYVYANCNAQTTLDSKSTADINTITTANNFWMTNAYTAQECNPIILSANEAEPFDLGEVYVERAMARFDFMKPAGAYTLTEDQKTSVTLTDMALINESKEFYYLRRTVANNKLDAFADNWVLGGTEIPTNYVVDADWDGKKADTPNYTSLFNNPFSTFASSISKYSEWTAISSLTNKDNWTDTGDNAHTNQDYYFWRYAKENTVPGKEYQLNGLTTGVVFKGEISSTDENIKADMTAGKTLYVFDDILYGSWDRVVTAADAAEANVTLKYYVEEIWEKTEPTNNDDLAAAGFTTFKPTTVENTNKYYTYYYYWNRHNDNGQPTVMGDMEFAVVRNNVYKLCVDKINKLGHPDENGADPDPETPTDPDESGEYYFKVTVKVLPWTVRVNHIEF